MMIIIIIIIIIIIVINGLNISPRVRACQQT